MSLRKNASDNEEVVTDYGGELTAYPDAIQLDVIEFERKDSKKEWIVVAPILTKEER